MPVDNDLSDRMSETWWDDAGFLNILASGLNPVRVPFLERQLRARFATLEGLRVLDLGCGGGLLAEEMARLGCVVTGVDPSRRSLGVAHAHAHASGLDIDCMHGVAEALQVAPPAGAEARLSQFTELVATAISNSQAREDLQRLPDEQAALRRLATLVAEGAEPRGVFDAVAEETGRLIGATTVNLAHFTPDAINVTMSGWSLRDVHVPAGTRLPIDGDSITPYE